jgi:hypothetical protein
MNDMYSTDAASVHVVFIYEVIARDKYWEQMGLEPPVVLSIN